MNLSMAANSISIQQMMLDLQEAFAFFIHTTTSDHVAGGMAVETIAAMMETVDADGDDDVVDQFQELFNIMVMNIQAKQEAAEEDTEEEELKEAFQVFDKDQDGFISPTELRQVMINLGEKLTVEEAEQMIKEADLDGDGLVNYQEFVNMMTSMPL